MADPAPPLINNIRLAIFACVLLVLGAVMLAALGMLRFGWWPPFLMPR